MRFKFLSGDLNWSSYGGKFISKKLNNGDFDYWQVIEVINMNEVEHNPPFKYMVTLYAVSPSEAGEENIKRALDCCGIEEDNPSSGTLVEALSDYGVSAQLWNDGGNNLKELLKEAHKQASVSETLFGFYMDKPENRMGSTGWDFIKGDIDAGLDRWRAEREANKNER